MNTVKRGFGAVAALALILLTACGSDNDSKSSDGTTPVPVDANPGGGDQSLNGGGEAASDTTISTTGTTGSGNQPGTQIPGNVLVPDNRQLIITMTVGVEVTDAAAAVDKVIDLAAAHGGQLYDSSLDLTDAATASGNLVFKLPPEEVDGFLRGLEPGIGRRTGLQGTTSDVTRQLSDLDAQILTAQASVERVRALLDNATNLGEVITLEGELSTRQTRLEQLLAQRADLDGQVALATITVHLTTAPVKATVAPKEKEEETGISAAFEKGWEAFLAVLTALLLFVGYTAPFLVLGGIAVWVVWRISRRVPRSRSAAPPPPPTPAASPHTTEPDSVGAARIP